MATEKPYNQGTWTASEFNSWIISALRARFLRWGPRTEALKRARVARGLYLCAKCNQVGPASLAPEPGKTKRKNNAVVDHIDPVVCPYQGYQGWNIYIQRMFVEPDGLQVLCRACHRAKTGAEMLSRLGSKRAAKASLDGKGAM